MSQEIRPIIGPEENAPDGTWRRVHLIVPMDPKMFADLDKTPEWYGLNRTYKLPAMCSGNTIIFTLMPHQSLVAASEEGIAEASIIVEYLE